MKIVECVPNFSEGRDMAIIDAIAASIRSTPGCTLLDVDPGKTTNRTVVTFVGEPAAVVDGAVNAARVAKEKIDMRNHKGAHARMGAMDVCPFVPVANVTVDECIECSKKFGKRAAAELGIPVYLYEDAATLDYRKSLKQIRAGEYEALADRIVQPKWKPDFGPAMFIPTYGATVTGSRFFLIAYNVNILGTKEQSNRIAFNVREMGRPALNQPGRLKEVKGCGWFLDEHNMAQVSMNLDNYKVTGIHTAFEECKKDATELNVAVAGSEIVGLVPLEAIIDAADYYIKKEGLFIVHEDQKVRLVVERLGLSSVNHFDPKKRIIEYLIPKAPTPLADLSLSMFIESVAARTTAPGGGSVSACVASLGAALGAMVGMLTYGKRKFEDVENVMRERIPPLYDAYRSLSLAVDADTSAFFEYMEAMKLPKTSPEEIAVRESAIQEGLKSAILVPLNVLEVSASCWPCLVDIATKGQLSSWSDVVVGAKCLEAGMWGAHKNVIINLADITDNEWKKSTKEHADTLLAKAGEFLAEIVSIIQTRNAK